MLRDHQFAALQPGPRLIVAGAVHGNEICGTKAIERVLGEIARGELEIARGVLTLVPACNPLAYAHGRCFGERNLNRRLLPSAAPTDYEDRKTIIPSRKATRDHLGLGEEDAEH